MSILFFLLFGTTPIYSSELNLISDKEFVKQYTPQELSCLISDQGVIDEKDLTFISRVGMLYDVSPLVLCTKIEQEQSLFTRKREDARDNACGCGSYVKWKTGRPYAGSFEEQIICCAKTLSYWYDQWKPKIKVEYKDCSILPKGHPRYIIPSNAATYALYKYCPVYGEYRNIDGSVGIGNRVFELAYARMKKQVSQCDNWLGKTLILGFGTLVGIGSWIANEERNKI